MGTHTIPTTTALIHKIGALSFSDYSKLKILYLSADATDSDPKAMYDVATSAAYQVPTGKVFIGGKVTHYMGFDTICGRIGEADSAGGAISKDVLAFGTGTTYPGTNDVIGMFAGDKYVSAESSHTSQPLERPTLLYGVEVLVVPAITIQYDIGGYLCTDYNKIKLLILPSDAADDTPKTFHDVAGSDYVVPTGKVFIAGIVCFYLDPATNIGRIGESDSIDGAISREVLWFSKGGTTVGMLNVLGIFRAGKYITGESNSGFPLQKPTYLYGAEIDA